MGNGIGRIQRHGTSPCNRGQHGNNGNISPLMNNQGSLVNELEEICKVFQERYTLLLGVESSRNVRGLRGLPCQCAASDGQEVRCCGELITTVEETLSDCVGYKSPGLHGLLDELYNSMLNLFEHLLTCVFINWQQKGIIPRRVSRKVVMLLRQDPNKGNIIDNCRLITLLNTDFIIFSKILSKWLAHVLDTTVGEAQTCVVPVKFHNLNLQRYILWKINAGPVWG